MKKSVFSISVLSALVSCFAWGYSAQKPWDLCQSLSPDEAKDKCYKVVDRHGHFDELAVGVCAGYGDAWTEIKCLKVIEGKHYSRAALDRCDAITDRDESDRCLTRFANHHFDHDAVDACNRIPEGHDRDECWKAIEDKHFRDWQVKRCDNYESKEGTIRCFRQFGGTASLETPDFNQAVATVSAQPDDDSRSDAERALKHPSQSQAAGAAVEKKSSAGVNVAI